MTRELTWDEFRATCALEQISLARAALLLALDRGNWDGNDFTDEELRVFFGKPKTWQSTHKMETAAVSGAVKAAHKAILAVMIKEVDSGRLKTIFTGRHFGGDVDPDRTRISPEGYEFFAELLGLETGDLWEDYRTREDRITFEAIAAAEAARLRAEQGDSLLRHPPADYSALPQWAQDELRYQAQVLHINGKLEQRIVKQRAPGSREIRTLHNMIGALVETCLDQSPGGQRYSVFTSQAALIDVLVTRYPNLPGVAQRTLEGLLSKARKALQEQ